MSGEGDEVDDKDDGGVTQETEPTEITPLIHQHRTYGPGGRVLAGAVDDPNEYGNLAWWLSLINPRSEHPTIRGPQGDEIA